MKDIQEYKLNVHVEPMSGLHMSDYDFKCLLFVYPNKAVEIQKDQMVEVDQDNYTVAITADMVKQLNKGMLKLKFVAKIKDDDFDDGYRTEIAEVCTDIVIA